MTRMLPRARRRRSSSNRYCGPHVTALTQPSLRAPGPASPGPPATAVAAGVLTSESFSADWSRSLSAAASDS